MSRKNERLESNRQLCNTESKNQNFSVKKKLYLFFDANQRSFKQDDDIFFISQGSYIQDYFESKTPFSCPKMTKD